jgi:hypothetical protein
VRHQHAKAQQAGQELLVVEGIALGAHLIELLLQRLEGRQRVAGERFQRHIGQQPAALSGRHLAQEQLARGRTVRGHARARMQIKRSGAGVSTRSRYSTSLPEKP